MGELVTHRTRHLRLEQLRIVPEIPQQRVTEDHDPVMEEVPGARVTLVEAVRAPAPTAVGDHDRHVLQCAVELERQLVDRGAHERAEVLVLGRCKQVVVLVGVGGGGGRAGPLPPPPPPPAPRPPAAPPHTTPPPAPY